MIELTESKLLKSETQNKAKCIYRKVEAFRLVSEGKYRGPVDCMGTSHIIVYENLPTGIYILQGYKLADIT